MRCSRLLRTKQQLAGLCEMPPTHGYPHRLKGRHESPISESPFTWLSLTGISVPPRNPNNNNDEDEEDEDEDEEDEAGAKDYQGPASRRDIVLPSPVIAYAERNGLV
jgi:hypothetical protein